MKYFRYSNSNIYYWIVHEVQTKRNSPGAAHDGGPVVLRPVRATPRYISISSGAYTRRHVLPVYRGFGSTLTAAGLFQSLAPRSGTLSRILSGTWRSVQTASDRLLKTYLFAQIVQLAHYGFLGIIALYKRTYLLTYYMGGDVSFLSFGVDVLYASIYKAIDCRVAVCSEYVTSSGKSSRPNTVERAPKIDATLLWCCYCWY